MLVKVLAINGSPRTKCNTATLLNNALEGAASRGAETELVHLYKLNFKGCISCFACKLKNGESYGRCAVNDDLTPILTKAEEARCHYLGLSYLPRNSYRRDEILNGKVDIPGT